MLRVGSASRGQEALGVLGANEVGTVGQGIVTQAVAGENTVLGCRDKIHSRIVIVLVDDVLLRSLEVDVVGCRVCAGDVGIGELVQIGQADGVLAGSGNDVQYGIARLGCADS